MSDTQRLKELWRPFAKAALTDDELRRRRAVRIAVNDDGGINEAAVYQALPWQARDFHIAGALVEGANAAQQIRVRQPSLLMYADASAKTAPAGGSLVMELVIAGGGAVQTITIVSGETSGTAPSHTLIAIPGNSLLRLNVLSARGAADVSVTVWLVPDAGGA